jgi:preprotein translocase subunit SecD
MLEFRKVVQTEPAGQGSKAQPSSAPGPAEIDKAKAARQNLNVSDRAAVRAALDALNCSAPDPLRGKDDPNLPLITCDPAAPAKYVLERAFLTARHVQAARAERDPNGVGFVVNLVFTTEGARLWADFTRQNVDKQVAVVVDAAVLSAPTIQEPILRGETVISGGAKGFSRRQAEDLAARLLSR